MCVYDLEGETLPEKKRKHEGVKQSGTYNAKKTGGDCGFYAWKGRGEGGGFGRVQRANSPLDATKS